MTKQELVDRFRVNHQELIDYVDSLTDESFLYSYDGKWTAGQQLSHIYLCLLPLSKILVSKEVILRKFGKINRETWDYDTVIGNYFKTSLKTLDRFLPEYIHPEQKRKLIADFQDIVLTIHQLLERFTEEELDSLVLPHPLLGNLTIREMFYLTTYHPTHHMEQARQNLDQR